MLSLTTCFVHSHDQFVNQINYKGIFNLTLYCLANQTHPIDVIGIIDLTDINVLLSDHDRYLLCFHDKFKNLLY